VKQLERSRACRRGRSGMAMKSLTVLTNIDRKYAGGLSHRKNLLGADTYAVAISCAYAFVVRIPRTVIDMEVVKYPAF
jgi:hypothetical protein